MEKIFLETKHTNEMKVGDIHILHKYCYNVVQGATTSEKCFRFHQFSKFAYMCVDYEICHINFYLGAKNVLPNQLSLNK